MYNNYYGFLDNPFNLTSDPEFFFPSSQHEEAFSHLSYGIQQRKGILVVSGEIGTGKTTLCRTLLTRLSNNVRTALILNPSFSEVQLLKLVLKDFGLPAKGQNKLALIDTLNSFLLEQSSLGNNIVLIIDEAQNLKVPQLEQIRLLSNLETEKQKLLQIILVGQPELIEKLKLTALRQLNQRVSVRYHILPLKENEIETYIKHRLRVACRATNGTLPVTFSQKALMAIALFTKGTPRLINALCDRALLAGMVQETTLIDEKIISKCAREVG